MITILLLNKPSLLFNLNLTLLLFKFKKYLNALSFNEFEHTSSHLLRHLKLGKSGDGRRLHLVTTLTLRSWGREVLPKITSVSHACLYCSKKITTVQLCSL